MQEELIDLQWISYDKRARDGTWCTLPYPGHPNGCKNFPDCPKKFSDFFEIAHLYKWYAVIEKFDLKKHAEEYKKQHKDATERQCRNLLYWQPGVKKRLYQKALKHANLFNDDIILKIPEATGINMFTTMAKAGIMLQRNPDTVIKIMLIGRKRDVTLPQ